MLYKYYGTICVTSIALAKCVEKQKWGSLFENSPHMNSSMKNMVPNIYLYQDTHLIQLNAYVLIDVYNGPAVNLNISFIGFIFAQNSMHLNQLPLVCALDNIIGPYKLISWVNFLAISLCFVLILVINICSS